MRAGRFRASLEATALQYSQSVSFDWRLYSYDIAGSIAHATALAAAKIITADELAQIEQGLRDIEAEIAAGTFEWDRALEDVHMNIEARLTERIGAAGAKLHTARSRNDQVALDLRLFVREEIKGVREKLRGVQRALLQLGSAHQDVIMPGYTHLQRAQPVPFAHYALSFIEALERDHQRLGDCAVRVDVLPLGSGAIAGSTIALDRALIVKKLGFSTLSHNSIDAVCDRDFVCEFLFCLALIGTHLSRLSEDLILWSTAEFGFVTFSEEFSTGSSLMPQKKNPDMAELTRGKTGRLYGNLMSLLTTLKGLPTSYNRDLQEDKQPLFDSVDTVASALTVFIEMLPTLTINAARMEEAAGDANLLATDLAEALVKNGLPFRAAHEAVGKMVADAAAQGVSLRQVASQSLGDARSSLMQRTAVGAPSPENVARELGDWEKRLAAG